MTSNAGSTRIVVATRTIADAVVLFFSGAPTAQAHRISIIPPFQQFVNRQNEQNNCQEKSRICALLPVDF